MNTKRSYVSVVELNGLIYAMGGYDGKRRLESVERYDPKTNQWELLPDMDMNRSDAHACVLDNKIYIIGLFNFLLLL